MTDGMFPRSFGFISPIHLLKSLQKIFARWWDRAFVYHFQADQSGFFFLFFFLPAAKLSYWRQWYQKQQQSTLTTNQTKLFIAELNNIHESDVVIQVLINKLPIGFQLPIQWQQTELFFGVMLQDKKIQDVPAFYIWMMWSCIAIFIDR